MGLGLLKLVAIGDENEILNNDPEITFFKKKIENINSFELKLLNLRSYYHDNMLAFGDLLHKVHPLAGQGFILKI